MTQGAEAFLRAVTDFLFVDQEPFMADVILVPGNREASHAVRAGELYRRGYSRYVLPSGRFSKVLGRFEGPAEEQRVVYPGEYATEWDYLRAVLMRCGVPEQAILREDRATYTWENAQLSRAVTDAAGLTVRRAILCCKAHHARRALLYYQAAFPETEFRVCPTPMKGIARTDWFRTPAGRTAVLGELARCGSQIGEVLTTMLEEADPPCPQA